MDTNKHGMLNKIHLLVDIIELKKTEIHRKCISYKKKGKFVSLKSRNHKHTPTFTEKQCNII